MWRIVVLLLVLMSIPAADTAKVSPTGEEVDILQRLNEHRANWSDGDIRMIEAIRSLEVPANLQQWDAGKAGSGQAPPLVFNPILITVARGLLAQHAVNDGKTRFDAAETLQTMGYAPAKDNLAMFVYDAPSLAVAYELAMLNSLSEVPFFNNTTRPLYACSEALKPEFREAGVAVSMASKGKVNLVIVLGAGSALRYLGGLAYIDANRDHRYGLEEGKAGVVVNCGGESMTTGASGAWWLALASSDALEVTCTSGDLTTSHPLAKGASNQSFAWRIPPKADLKDADRLIAEAQKVVALGDEDKSRIALFKLLTGTRLKILDPPRTATIASLTDPIQAEFTQTLHDLESSLTEDPEEVVKRLATQKKSWKNANPAWFKSFEALAQTHQQVFEFLAGSAEQAEHLRSGLASQIREELAHPGDPSFLEQYLNWLSQVDRAQALAFGSRTSD